MNVPVRPPDFDDERTILSASQVVPLEKIDAKVRRRRHWVLGGAFAVAMMLGAASALLASYLRMRNLPTATATEVLEPDVAPAPLAVAQNVPSPTPAESPVTGQSEDALLEEVPKQEPVLKRRTVAKHTPEPIAPREDPQVSENERLQQIRDAVLYDEWQERRARRVFRRERRRLDRYHHRDLSNLNEIFEGRRP